MSKESELNINNKSSLIAGFVQQNGLLRNNIGVRVRLMKAPAECRFILHGVRLIQVSLYLV